MPAQPSNGLLITLPSLLMQTCVLSNHSAGAFLFDAPDFPMLYTHRYDKNLSPSDKIHFKSIG
jgi:hypothetical protein